MPAAAPLTAGALTAGTLAAGAYALGLTLGASSSLAPGVQALGAPGTIEAQSLSWPDADLDGIVDPTELILGTSPFEVDTDHDGFGDLEEIARQSDPLVVYSAPEAAALSVGMFGRANAGTLQVAIPVYLPASDLAGVDLRLGIRVGQTMMSIPPSVWLPMATYTLHLGQDPADSVLTLYLAIPQSLVSTFGGMSFYALATPPSSIKPTSAAVLNLSQSGPVTLQVIPFGSGDTDVSSAYRPLNDAPEIPPSWAPGELCTRSTTTVGLVGKVLIQEVIDARCEAADGFCVPTCSASIGSQEELLDPLILLGG